MSSIERICKYCNQVYCNKSSLSRHINYFCHIVPEDVKQKLALKRKQRSIKSQQPPQIAPQQNDNSINISNDNKQIIINFINVCGNDVPEDVIKSIKEFNESAVEKLRDYIPNLLCPFKSENIAHIIDDESKIKRYFKNAPSETFELLLNDIHNIDENRNFGVPNVKFAIVQFVNDNYDISKADKLDHIISIQRHMHRVYRNLLEKIRDKLHAKYVKEHDIFLKNMLRAKYDIVEEFNQQSEKERDEEHIRLIKEAEDRGEFFDDRSFLNKPLPVCPIPDYNEITKNIIETYLTTNSKINVQTMNKHKTNVFAIKKAIVPTPQKKKFKTPDDLEEELATKRKIKQATAKIQESVSMGFQNMSDTDLPDEEMQLMDELERQRDAE